SCAEPWLRASRAAGRARGSRALGSGRARYAGGVRPARGVEANQPQKEDARALPLLDPVGGRSGQGAVPQGRVWTRSPAGGRAARRRSGGLPREPAARAVSGGALSRGGVWRAARLAALLASSTVAAATPSPRSAFLPPPGAR